MRGRIAAVLVLLAAAGCSAARPAPEPSSSSGSVVGRSERDADDDASVPRPDHHDHGTRRLPAPPLTRVTPNGAPDSDDQALVRQGLAALATFGGPVATSAFRHYVDASGTYLTLPVDELLTAEPALVADLNVALVDAAAAAVATAAAGPSCTTVPFSSGWHGHTDPVDADWRYALGRFYAQLLGTVTRDASGALRVSYRAAIGDTYDFDPGSTFAEFARLATDGHAAVFLDGGLTTPRTATVTRAADLASPGFG